MNSLLNLHTHTNAEARAHSHTCTGTSSRTFLKSQLAATVTISKRRQADSGKFPQTHLSQNVYCNTLQYTATHCNTL